MKSATLFLCAVSPACLAEVHKTKVTNLTSIPKEAEVVCETTRDGEKSDSAFHRMSCMWRMPKGAT